MIRVSALTSGRNVPSARFRIRQYISSLNENGISVTEYCPVISQGARLPGLLGRIRGRYLPPVIATQSLLNLGLRIPGIVGSYQADITWLERNFIPGLDDFAWLLKRPIVLDIDDAIWLYNPFGQSMIKRLVRRADMVFAGNKFIADWCSNYCQTIQIVPTAIDDVRFKPRPKPKEPSAPFVIGWTGTSGNFHFLKMVEPVLAQFLRDYPLARLLVVADRRPELDSLPPSQFSFQKWKPDTEHLVLHEMDVGIMPIDDTDLSRGKCSFKMLQYMAVGLPVIASPYGMNGEILKKGKIGFSASTHSDWINALNVCVAQRRDLFFMGQVGRSVVDSDYSINTVAKLIIKGFGSIGLG